MSAQNTLLPLELVDKAIGRKMQVVSSQVCMSPIVVNCYERFEGLFEKGEVLSVCISVCHHTLHIHDCVS